MKKTKEQSKLLAAYSREGYEYTKSADYEEGIIDGANWAIENFGGIQWKEVNEVNDYPPEGKQLLALSPEGTLHLCFWRWGYRIFDVQNKRESSSGWWWTEINLPSNN